ncbi:hypothetical protein RRG08_018504 [Elysia crispata]|uniref:Uncharacterized protein n=1 Tax=Elysia crispata TaxID=231223 RepID=A0AAE0Y2B6_9GAST|nr:hypothetical protein RRG08_018504 [Elysia crispata]
MCSGVVSSDMTYGLRPDLLRNYITQCLDEAPVTFLRENADLQALLLPDLAVYTPLPMTDFLAYPGQPP